jgi:UDP-N-acetylglucosamine 1-carboxyvinyltransferase
VDLHLQALEALGAKIDLHEGYVYAQAPRGLKGAEITFPFVSVGATEHAMLAAVLADGATTDPQRRLRARTARPADLPERHGRQGGGRGDPDHHHHRRRPLHGATHSVIPDRIEMGTYAVAAAMAGGEVQLTRARPADRQPAGQAGRGRRGVERTEDGCIIRRNGRA